MMQILYPILFVFLIVGPVLLAWLKGDQILDRLAIGRRQQQQRKRRRTTRALPLRVDMVQSLLNAEAQRNQIDNRMGEALVTFRQISENGALGPAQDTTSATLDDMEKILLARESEFNTYIDIAWLQSETIELLAQEVTFLRQMAELPDDQPPPAPAPASSATEHLLQNLDAAVQRRAQIDRRLNLIGTTQQRPTPVQ